MDQVTLATIGSAVLEDRDLMVVMEQAITVVVVLMAQQEKVIEYITLVTSLEPVAVAVAAALTIQRHGRVAATAEQAVVDRVVQVSSMSIMLVMAEQEPMELVVEEEVAVVALKQHPTVIVQEVVLVVVVGF
jgi:hypothetical protein